MFRSFLEVIFTSKYTHIKSASLALLICLSFICISNAKFDVHIIYFKPTDAPDIDREFHDKILKDIQKYVQSEMTRHGFTGKTFPLELDEDDKLVIHVINGKHNSNHYDIADDYNAHLSLDVYNNIQDEFPFKFNNSVNVNSRDNIHLVIMGGIKMNGDWRNAPAMGLAWHGGRWGGNALETMDRMHDFPNHYLAVIAHELGHAFGLDPGHNEVRQAFNGLEIAFGKTTADWNDRMRILDFEAALMDSRPIFRKTDLTKEDSKPNKNEDLISSKMGEDDSNKDKGEPLSANVRNNLTTKWASIKHIR